MKNISFFLIFLIVIITGSSVYAETVFPGETFGYGRTEKLPINFSEIPTVNSTDNWITNIGVLSNVNDTQFDNIANALTIDPEYLKTFGNDRWCELTGCTMSGEIEMDGNNINMGGGNITNIRELQSTDGSAIKNGDSGIFLGVDQAINLQTNQTLGAGVITHVLTDLQGQRVIEAWQSGKNNSWGFHRNSYGVFGDLGITNASLLTNARFMWQNISINPMLDYDTTNQGASLGVQYGIETQQLFIHDDIGNGELLGEGLFRWIGRDGDDIDLYEAAVHILDLSIKEFGFDAGANLTLITENFENGDLGIFTLITSGKGLDEWSAETSIDCPPNGLFCAGAGPTGGSLATIMQTNFSTINLQDMSLNFTLNTDSMASGGVFVVTINNNIGSGDVILYSLIGADELDATITAALPVSMEDKSIVTLEYSFLSTHPIRGDAWVDAILINATTSISTLVNQTVSQGEIEFGSGDCTIKQDVITGAGETQMNITCDNINLVGNVTQTIVTEIELNVTDNVTANNFIARENFYQDGIKINDTFFRVGGESTMQGNTNQGGYDIFNVSVLNITDGYVNGSQFISAINLTTKLTYVAERNTVVSGNYWAMGNGAQPIGVPVLKDGTLTSFGVQCNVVGTSLTMSVRKNGINTGCNLTVGSVANQGYTNLTCDTDFAVGDLIGFYANVETGIYSTCTASAIIEIDFGQVSGLKGDTGEAGINGTNGSVIQVGTFFKDSATLLRIALFNETDGSTITSDGAIGGSSGGFRYNIVTRFIDAVLGVYFGESSSDGNFIGLISGDFTIWSVNDLYFNLNGGMNYFLDDVDIAGTLTADTVTYISTDHPQLTGHEIVTRERAKELAEANTPYNDSIVDWVERDKDGLVHWMSVDMQTGNLYELPINLVGSVDWVANATYTERYRWDSASGTSKLRRVHESKNTIEDGKVLNGTTGEIFDKPVSELSSS